MKSRIAAVLAALTLALPVAACGNGDPATKPTTATPPTAVARKAAPTDGLTVQTANGTGCPAGTVTTTVSDNDVAATFDAFTVTAGGTGFRKVCQLNVLVHPGAGKQAVVTKATYAGSATLPGSSTGKVKTSYYVTGGPDYGSASSNLTAPTWAVDQDAPAATVTACGADVALNVKVELSVSGAGSTATVTAGSVHVDWQDC